MLAAAANSVVTEEFCCFFFYCSYALVSRSTQHEPPSGEGGATPTLVSSVWSSACFLNANPPPSDRGR